MERFAFPSTIKFGPGAVSSLKDSLSELGVSKPLLVTDAGIVECGLVDKILAAVGMDVEEVFSQVDANPSESNVRAGVEAFRRGEFDGIVGLGGGSALDAAKGIRLLACHPGPLRKYGIRQNGWERMTEPMPEMIAIPTTAGTGSEVARGALLIEATEGAKIAVVGPRLFPSMSISDPELTVGLPRILTAGTGMDALTHCIEEYLSPQFNPIVEGLALEGVRRVQASLIKACHNGFDIAARSDMMVAAMLGGMGFAKGLGIVHSLSHAIGGLFGGHHGTLNAILLPACLEFNRESCLPKFRLLAQAAGIPVEGMDDQGCADAFIEHIVDLNTNLELSLRLSELGINESDLDRLAEYSMKDHCHLTNPKKPALEDFKSLLKLHL
jgi:4-hydroxybutyrate dehydrogenase